MKQKLKNYNYRLALEVIIVNIFGILIIGSANASYQKTQIYGMILGIVCMILFSLIDYNFLMKLAWLDYAAMVILLALTLTPIFSHSSKGASRWFLIGGFRFQPSELAKIMFIFFLAYFFAKIETKLNMLKFILLSVVLGGIPIFLIFKEHDLSTTIVVTLVFCFMYFAAGLSWKIVLGVLAVAFPTAVIAFSLILTKGETFLEHYQYLRIMAWLRPQEYAQSAIQQKNAIMAIGSGQLFGKGLNNSDVLSLKNGKFIPEPHTDFIFSIVGEELGFVGCVFLIGMILIICLECLFIAKKAKNTSGKLLCAGMASLLAIQSFVNLCVNTGLMPNTGLTLPFVSYGLTSLISMYIGIGFVLGVSTQPKKIKRTGGFR